MSEVCDKRHRIVDDRIVHRNLLDDDWVPCDLLNAPLKLAASRATVAIAEEKTQRAKRQEFADELARVRALHKTVTADRDALRRRLRYYEADDEGQPRWEDQAKFMEQERDNERSRRINAEKRAEKYKERRDDILEDLKRFGTNRYNISMSVTEKTRLEDRTKELQQRIVELEDQLLLSHDQYQAATGSTDWPAVAKANAEALAAVQAEKVKLEARLATLTASKKDTERRFDTILDGLVATLEAVRDGKPIGAGEAFSVE